MFHSNIFVKKVLLMLQKVFENRVELLKLIAIKMIMKTNQFN